MKTRTYDGPYCTSNFTFMFIRLRAYHSCAEAKRQEERIVLNSPGLSGQMLPPVHQSLRPSLCMMSCSVPRSRPRLTRCPPPPRHWASLPDHDLATSSLRSRVSPVSRMSGRLVTRVTEPQGRVTRCLSSRRNTHDSVTVYTAPRLRPRRS